MIKPRIKYNVTDQTLTWECPHGRPSADGTVTLYDCRYEPEDTDHNPIVTGTASRQGIDVTMNDDAGPAESDPRNIPVAAASMTAITSLLKRGQGLFLTTASKEVERIVVEKWGSTSIGSRDKLWHTYASGALVQSALLTSPAIPSEFIQDEDNILDDYYAEWVITVGGVTYRERSYFDIVRDTTAPTVEKAQLVEAYPILERLLRNKEFESLRRSCQRDLDMLLRMRGYKPHRLRGNEMVGWLLEKMILWKGAVHTKDPTLMDVTKEEWDQAHAQFLEGRLPIPYDADDNDAHDAERGAMSIDLDR